MTPLVCIRALLVASLATAVFGCAVNDESDVGTANDALSVPTAPSLDMPVIVLTVDESSRAWLSTQTSIVDGEPVGTDSGRQRELYLRLQKAINQSIARPKLVYYGLHFSGRNDVRKVTDAFSAEVDSSKIPVILERNTSAGDADSTLYHNWSLSNPSPMVVTENLGYQCVDDRCSQADINLVPQNRALLTLPVALRTAGIMAAGQKRSDATVVAKRDLGVTSDGGYAPRTTVTVKTTKNGFRSMPLKDVLAGDGGLGSLVGAAVIVAPNDALEDAKDIGLADIFGAIAVEALGATRVRFGAPQG